MGGSQFDSLVVALTTTDSRRRALGGLLAGALSLLSSRERSQADRNRRPRGFQCKTAGTKCIHTLPKGKKATGKLCRKCCQTFRKVSKRVGVCCTRNGRSCESAAECCLGVCSAGVCQNTAVRNPLRTPCTTVADCGIQIGDVYPNVPDQCALIHPQKGPRTCGNPDSGDVAVCCRPSSGSCSDDCECCGDRRCRNGICGPPPPCHQRGEACTDGEPCCTGAGTCNGSICCLADGASCPCGEPGNCQGCCSGICGADGRCGSGATCVPLGQPCTAPTDCCLTLGDAVFCTDGLCSVT
jgi:hypothetical protein